MADSRVTMSQISDIPYKMNIWWQFNFVNQSYE